MSTTETETSASTGLPAASTTRSDTAWRWPGLTNAAWGLTATASALSFGGTRNVSVRSIQPRAGSAYARTTYAAVPYAGRIGTEIHVERPSTLWTRCSWILRPATVR